MNMFEEIEKIKAELPQAKNVGKEIKRIKLNFYQIFSCGTTSALYSGVCVTTEFNFSLMLCIWFVGLIICMFIFAIGHIINLLEAINKKLKK